MSISIDVDDAASLPTLGWQVNAGPVVAYRRQSTNF
jgi:hypothetical protein